MALNTLEGAIPTGSTQGRYLIIRDSLLSLVSKALQPAVGPLSHFRRMER